MEKSESIGNLAKALVEFHRKVTPVTKEAVNPFFKSKYASLSNIIDTIKPTLTECGLTLMQFPIGEDGLHSILVHAESGEYIGAYYEMPVAKKDDPQALGSSITYARRYSLQSILMINVEEDDDGNKASGKRSPNQISTAPPKEKPTLHPKHEKWNDAIDFLKKSGIENISGIKLHYNLSPLDEQELINELSKKSDLVQSEKGKKEVKNGNAK